LKRLAQFVEEQWVALLPIDHRIVLSFLVISPTTRAIETRSINEICLATGIEQYYLPNM
jgi:hypothetical protein